MTGSDPKEPDSDEYWERNEYEALRMMFAEAGYHEAARADPEAFERYQAYRKRLKELHEKFGPKTP